MRKVSSALVQRFQYNLLRKIAAKEPTFDVGVDYGDDGSTIYNVQVAYPPRGRRPNVYDYQTIDVSDPEACFGQTLLDHILDGTGADYMEAVNMKLQSLQQGAEEKPAKKEKK